MKCFRARMRSIWFSPEIARTRRLTGSAPRRPSENSRGERCPVRHSAEAGLRRLPAHLADKDRGTRAAAVDCALVNGVGICRRDSVRSPAPDSIVHWRSCTPVRGRAAAPPAVCQHPPMATPPDQPAVGAAKRPLDAGGGEAGSAAGSGDLGAAQPVAKKAKPGPPPGPPPDFQPPPQVPAPPPAPKPEKGAQ